MHPRDLIAAASSEGGGSRPRVMHAPGFRFAQEIGQQRIAESLQKIDRYEVTSTDRAIPTVVGHPTSALVSLRVLTSAAAVAGGAFLGGVGGSLPQLARLNRM